MFLDVPCGCCPECLEQRKSDYFVRIYKEYEHCIANGGLCYFETLTYNESSIPRLFGRICFSRDHIAQFIKAVKRGLSRYGYSFGKNGSNHLHYFVTCEYGDECGRCHYHVILFLYCPCLSVEVLKPILNRAWNPLPKGISEENAEALTHSYYEKLAAGIKPEPNELDYSPYEYFPRGFLNPSRGYKTLFGKKQHVSIYTWLVNDYVFLSYAAKYCVKQLKFEDQFSEWYDELVKKELSLPSCMRFNQVFNKQKIYHLVGPFVLCSNNLGYCMAPEISDDVLRDGSIKLSATYKGIDKDFAIPQYIKRKLLKDFTKETRSDGSIYVRWFNNERGITYLSDKKTFAYGIKKLALRFGNRIANAARFAQVYGSSITEAERTRLNYYLSLIDDQFENQSLDLQTLAEYFKYIHSTYCPGHDHVYIDPFEMCLNSADPTRCQIFQLDHTETVYNRTLPFIDGIVRSEQLAVYRGCDVVLASLDAIYGYFTKNKLFTKFLKLSFEQNYLNNEKINSIRLDSA